MNPVDITILTDSRYVNPADPDLYTQNILKEDQLVLDALKAQNLKVERRDWNDPHYDWSKTSYALFRTTWDYFDKFGEFKKWLTHVQDQTILINSISTIRWNMDKHYLIKFQQHGINIAATKIIKRKSTQSLLEIIKDCGWDKTVIKPTISGAGRHTYLINGNDTNKHDQMFTSIIKNEDMIIQEFQENVADEGEISMMMIGGNFTHAVLKKAKQGDFRVQDDFGGTVHDYEPNQDEIDFAVQVIKLCQEEPIYARVDIFEDNKGKLALAELELIEPEMWFRNNPLAANLLAETITDKYNF